MSEARCLDRLPREDLVAGDHTAPTLSYGGLAATLGGSSPIATQLELIAVVRVPTGRSSTAWPNRCLWARPLMTHLGYKNWRLLWLGLYRGPEPLESGNYRLTSLMILA